MACSDRSKAELCSFHEADHTFVTEQAVYIEVQTETETWWRAGESGGGVQEREAGDKTAPQCWVQSGRYPHLERQQNIPASVIGLAEETAYDPHGRSRLFGGRLVI